ncbi:hypothetical protein Glove_692g44 [Diversispora epigaea]|uniref:Protein kinase domain-containing protein n=1 Tax=Diversispora epigaea TaxID=1348612 RepID=A0A397G7Y9_9GLOM|nr:hypothetical protein Glove_692g44 [Diversispora epigaea]
MPLDFLHHITIQFSNQYKLYYSDNLGICSKCYQDNTGRDWCHPCNAKKFQNEFDKWTSGDKEIDKFIQQIQLNANKYQGVIKWIPFGRLKNVTYLAKGDFGTVYKANWFYGFIKTVQQGVWYRNGEQDIKNQFKFRGKNSIEIYGITKNPTKNEYMMVMNYAVYGSLRKMLNAKFEVLTWRRKSFILLSIIWGIKCIHEMGLMHKDFHPGNIVNQTLLLSFITDFGLCKPVTENDPEKIYGVIPYMAPETLSGGEYTQASDIYSFGMVMLEVLTSYPPYYNIPHNVNLAMDICKGLKPEIKCEIPQFFKEIMEKCLNFESLNRPTAKELEFQLNKYMQGDEIGKQIKAANKSNKNFIKYDPNEMHPEAIYTSRLIPKTTIPEYDTFIEDEENETQEMESFSPIWSARHHPIYWLIEVADEEQLIKLHPDIQEVPQKHHWEIATCNCKKFFQLRENFFKLIGYNKTQTNSPRIQQ